MAAFMNVTNQELAEKETSICVLLHTEIGNGVDFMMPPVIRIAW
jgi:hypothetical protein